MVCALPFYKGMHNKLMLYLPIYGNATENTELDERA